MMLRAAGLVLFALVAPGVLRAEIATANYSGPTTRYDHGILGDAVEWGALDLGMADGAALRITLPESRVFEDVAPRLFDLDRDGDPEVIVVETDLAQGAQLAIYDETGKIAATPFIGRTHRWLAPVGAADFDGDGNIEIAYVDRPHLARQLRLWRFAGGALREVTRLDQVTNHRIGDAQISGGVRDCGSGPEMIVASADWSRVLSVHWDPAGGLMTRDLGSNTGHAAFARALACKG